MIRTQASTEDSKIAKSAIRFIQEYRKLQVFLLYFLPVPDAQINRDLLQTRRQHKRKRHLKN